MFSRDEWCEMCHAEEEAVSSGGKAVRSRTGTGSKDGRRTWTDEESDTLRQVVESRDGEIRHGTFGRCSSTFHALTL